MDLVGGQRSKAEQRVGVKSSHELGCPSPHLEALQILVARFKMGTPHELAKRGGARRKRVIFKVISGLVFWAGSASDVLLSVCFIV